MYVSEDTFVHLRQAADERQRRELEYRRIAQERAADDERRPPARGLRALVQRFRHAEYRRAAAAFAPVTTPVAEAIHDAGRAAVCRCGCRRAVGRWAHASHGQPLAGRPGGRPRRAPRRLCRERRGLDQGRARRGRGGHRQDPPRRRVPAFASGGGDRAARSVGRLRPRRASVRSDPLRTPVAGTGGGRGGALRRIGSGGRRARAASARAERQRMPSASRPCGAAPTGSTTPSPRCSRTSPPFGPSCW